MTAFLPHTSVSGTREADHPRLHQRPPTEAERRARWEVRAAQWRAHELAAAVFGGSASALVASRAAGSFRGLLRLDVPFVDLTAHREHEARFLAAAAEDPILSRIPLVYVLGPDTA